jgi:hypothetical protein
MNSNTKGAIVVGLALGAVGLAYYFLVYKKDESAYDQFDNFKSLQNNIGLKPNNDDVVIAPFNDKKNFAQFYKNNRVIIFDSNKNILVKGSYSNGGYNMVLDNGKEISSNSVWDNLLQTIKNK